MLRPSDKSKQKFLVALRQLALTAPGGRVSLIEASRLIEHIVPTDNVAISWHDKHHNIIDMHHSRDMSLAVAQDFAENFMPSSSNLIEDAGIITLLMMHALNQPVANMTEGPFFDYQKFIRSEFYNRILRPVDLGRGLEVVMRHADNTTAASMTLARSFNSHEFTHVEIDWVEQIQPWLEHLARKDKFDANMVSGLSSGKSASLLIDAKGKVLSASAFALFLLHQAADTPLADKPLKQTAQGDVSILLRRLSNAVSSSWTSQFALPPSLTIDNHWGRFHLHAYVLNSFEAGAPLQISLHIDHKIPLSLALFHLPRFLELSPREREVALLILAGLDRNAIAQQLQVKPSTVVYFTRQLYQRLDVNQQSELLPALKYGTA
jgi:DNA-binding CsgD family transcriptional regulator